MIWGENPLFSETPNWLAGFLNHQQKSPPGVALQYRVAGGIGCVHGSGAEGRTLLGLQRGEGDGHIQLMNTRRIHVTDMFTYMDAWFFMVEIGKYANILWDMVWYVVNFGFMCIVRLNISISFHGFSNIRAWYRMVYYRRVYMHSRPV